MISRYLKKYNSDIVGLVKDFHSEALAEYGITLDLNVLSKTIDELKDGAYLFIADDKCQGMLVGKEVKLPTGTDRVWHEVVWYMNKKYRKYGVYLLNYVRQALKEEGFTAIVMICMESEKKDKLFNLYKRLGFKPMEHHFIGRL